uniref:Hexosyltransferase n=1 Tax=Coccolithus braarudii TaxID=221442 RepID=A0A7S0LQY0_9EUKA|mmetsp:Transcript_50897/g.108730  ORF Transcript_50897/g.108730 Transcript_50897/m.108730 type:complete len:529 (+) Transcript_50897:71-1657(+)
MSALRAVRAISVLLLTLLVLILRARLQDAETTVRPTQISGGHHTSPVEHASPRKPQLRSVPASAPHLLVLGIMCTESAFSRREILRVHYTAVSIPPGVLIRYFVDALSMAHNLEKDMAHIDALGNFALPICRGLASSDAPGSCTTKEARRMSKARGWWLWALKNIPSRFYGQTDDDCIIDLPRLAALLHALPSSGVYAGKMYYASVNGTSPDQLPLRNCFVVGDPVAALGNNAFHSECSSRARGPLPYAIGPLIVLSADVSAWLAAKSRVPLHSYEVTAHQADAQLGWELSFHPALHLTDLTPYMGGLRSLNVRRDAYDETYRGFDGIVAHKLMFHTEDVARVAAQQAAERAPAALGGRVGAGRGLEEWSCVPWVELEAAVEAFPPPMQQWRWCEGKGAALTLPAAAAPSASARRGLIQAPKWGPAVRQGFCSTTNGEADCTRATKGSFKIVREVADVKLSWQELLRLCLRRCSECERCNFISVSLAWEDCSWFSMCDLDDLHQFPRGFRSMVVQSGGQVAQLYLNGA